MQILDDERHPDAKEGVNGNRTAGSLNDLIALSTHAARPIGEWNQVRLVVRGHHVEHWLNGQKVVQFEIGSPEMKALIAKSKYKDIKGFGDATSGHILLQDHGDEVSFRNIKLRQLPGKNRPDRSMTFIHDGFLLHSDAARRLYRWHAAGQPVFDYHCHLPPADIASDRQFRNLFEIWLEGDHYKWRAMRANGIPEMYCTGDAEPVREVQGVGRDRAALPAQSALSLDASGAEALLRHRRTARRIVCADRIWQQANERLPVAGTVGARASCKNSASGPLHDGRPRRRARQSRAHSRSPTSGHASIPTFRPDRALDVHLPAVFNPWVDRLGGHAPTSTSPVSRICRTPCASGTTTSMLPAADCPTTASRAALSTLSNEWTAAATFDKARAGQAVERRRSRKASPRC